MSKSSWYGTCDTCAPCGTLPDDNKDDRLLIHEAYGELFANRIHDDQHEDRHYYNQLVPDYFKKEGKENLIRRSERFFDNCVRIASMPREKFVDGVCECFETEKEGFERWRNREILDLLDALPDKTIRGYLDMKGS